VDQLENISIGYDSSKKPLLFLIH